MKVGCHLSSSGGYLAMAQTAVSIGANVFQFFTRNPRGGAAKPIDKNDVADFLVYAKENGIGPILAHAPYTLNAASADPKVRDFAESVFIDDLKRLSLTPGALYNFHPGSHVGQGTEKGIELISEILVKVSSYAGETTILLETMSGKGSEVGRCFEEIKSIIDKFENTIRNHDLLSRPRLGVCLDTCHVWDGGYDIVTDLDGVVEEFDRIVGLDRLKAIHINDTMNALAAHKDRHEKIGQGQIGEEVLKKIIRNERVQGLSFILETPNDDAGYAKEIAMIKEWQKSE